ncbi:MULTISPECIES: Crp/Fnr family transcriptional regulator [Nocardiopsidaceae]|uniref:Crp/Fnr family transcriptional regulator n=1 Tax=Streptomonospora nanhaiensis TaxID=1323731 RepID=A0ABY6YH31_9ACTN|nr:Crp/Fnr family transcriptional regulator [Streptomonospora nanhaiensis]WAE71569.1 Crp/Fnr family transcriptional regulator [Streptomonospora nanhaiensis]
MPRHGFGGLLTDLEWARLTVAIPRTPFTPGQTLLRQGETGSGVHLILSGRARVETTRTDGTSVPLAFRSYGDVLGESVLAGEGRARNATVTAMCEGSTVYLTAPHFQSRLTELKLVAALWRSVFERQDESDQIRVQQAVLPAERRLPAALVHLASMLGEPIPAMLTDRPGVQKEGRLLRIPLPQQEIAAFAGLSRTSVHNAYTQLKEQGLIRTGRQYVAILDLVGLEALARGDNRD